MAPQTQLHHLNALGNLFSRAVSEGAVRENPVRRLHEKPTVAGGRREAAWVEIGEAARVLEAARTLDLRPHSRAVPYLHPIFATFLLTGGRKSEVLGMEVRDIDFTRGLVGIRRNDWRWLKRP